MADLDELTEVPPDADACFFSPSQVDNFLLCQRKWALKSIAKVKTPEKPSAGLGTETHGQLENYLGGGSLDYSRESGYIAASGIHLLPNPDMTGLSEDEVVELANAIEIEKEFRFQSPRTGFVWVGRMDLVTDDGKRFPSVEGEPDVPHGAPCVSDHKTTGNLRWRKTAETLKGDTQANVYAWALMTMRKSRVVDLVWTSYQTKGAKVAKRTHLRMYAEDVGQKFEEIEQVATDMAKHVRAARLVEDRLAYAQSVTPNTNACGDFGGCEFTHVCPLTLTEGFSAAMSDSLFSKLENQGKADDAKTGVMGCAPEAVPAPSGLPAWLRPATTTTGSTSVPALPADPINPPEAVAPVPGLSFLLPPEPTTAAIPPTQPASSIPDERPTATSLEETTTPAPQAEEPKKKGRGRPAGSKNKAKDAAPTPEQIEAAGAQGLGLASDMAERPEGRSYAPGFEGEDQKQHFAKELDHIEAHGFTLYIDCAPLGVPYTPAEEYILDAKERIRVEKGLADYRFAEFGQGPGLLSRATAAAVEAKPACHIVINTRTPEGQAVVTDLIELATFVVRAA